MLIKAGHQLPDPWRNIPQVESRLEWYFSAFSELSTCRQIGMGVGPIPWTAIVQYQDRHNLKEELGFLELIRDMDLVYISFVEEKNDGKKVRKS